MTMAWQARASERQQVVEEIITSIIHKEEDFGRNFESHLVELIIKYLREKGMLQLHQCLVIDNFLKTIIDEKITTFVRAEEERDAILGDVLTWLTRSIVGELHGNLRDAERKDSRKILGAENAMNEV